MLITLRIAILYNIGWRYDNKNIYETVYFLAKKKNITEKRNFHISYQYI